MIFSTYCSALFSKILIPVSPYIPISGQGGRPPLQYPEYFTLSLT